MSTPLAQIVRTLDTWLGHPDFPDFPGAHNGLQIEGGTAVSVIASAVDACAATSRAAVDAGADLLLVHHGLFWGVGGPLTGPAYAAVAPLIRKPCALYSSHLPLDAHPELGNNALLAERLGPAARSPFGHFEDRTIGLLLELDQPMGAEEAGRRLELALETGGAERHTARRVAVVSGSAASFIPEALRAGAEVLLTGEVKHHDRVLARDHGLTLWLGGHYATETPGVRALGDRLAADYDLRHVVLDLPTGG